MVIAVRVRCATACRALTVLAVAVAGGDAGSRQRYGGRRAMVGAGGAAVDRDS